MLKSQCCFHGKCREFASHLPYCPLLLWGKEEQNAPLRKGGMLSLQCLSFPLPRVWDVTLRAQFSLWRQSTANITCCVTLSKHSKLLLWPKCLVWSIKADMRAKHLLVNTYWLIKGECIYNKQSNLIYCKILSLMEFHFPWYCFSVRGSHALICLRKEGTQFLHRIQTDVCKYSL